MHLMKIHFRQATDADYDFLYDLMVVAMKEYVAAIWGWDEAWQRDYFRNKFSQTDWQVIVADGVDAGGVAIEERPNEIFLAYLYVLPEHQGRGIGTAVVIDVLKKAAQRGVPVTLDVLKSNPRARQLYEWLGFQVVEEEADRFILCAGPLRALP
jgi:ribosomal protein S18 acetylase RimI-like enzyme